MFFLAYSFVLTLCLYRVQVLTFAWVCRRLDFGLFPVGARRVIEPGSGKEGPRLPSALVSGAFLAEF